MFELLVLCYRNCIAPVVRSLKNHTAKMHQACVEILFPEFCVGCNKLGTLLCLTCYEQLDFIQFPTQLDAQKHENLDGLQCCCEYKTIAEKLIHELKYNSVAGVGATIGHILYYCLPIPECDVISFVSIHQKKRAQRGFNQTELIARALGDLIHKPVFELLEKTKHTRSQMSIARSSERASNITGTLAINKKISSELPQQFPKVLLIDDVFTSGATLNYCAHILKEFGFTQVHGICFTHKN